MVRGRGGLDTAGDNREEDLGEQTGGVLDDGPLTSSKNAVIYEAKDYGNITNQGNTGHIGDHQALHNSILGEVGVEDGTDGCMEVKGH